MAPKSQEPTRKSHFALRNLGQIAQEGGTARWGHLSFICPFQNLRPSVTRSAGALLVGDALADGVDLGLENRLSFGFRLRQGTTGPRHFKKMKPKKGHAHVENGLGCCATVVFHRNCQVIGLGPLVPSGDHPKPLAKKQRAHPFPAGTVRVFFVAPIVWQSL